MAEFVLPLAAIGGTLGLLVVAVAWFVLRRRLLLRNLGTFDCSLKRERGRSMPGWALGVARYESDRLDWFQLFTMSLRPKRSLSRSRLVILDRRPPQGPESYAVMPGAVIVRCAYGASMLELAMSNQAYDGFATWLESAPPGQGSLVT